MIVGSEEDGHGEGAARCPAEQERAEQEGLERPTRPRVELVEDVRGDRDEHGGFRPTPWYDWDDIIDLDYSKPPLRRYMTNAMLYWARDVGVDGYRVDAAGLSPLDFWEQAAKELRAVKPVFLLAEWESRDLHARADMQANAHDAAIDDHIYFSKEASSGGRGFAGGGCGCN